MPDPLKYRTHLVIITPYYHPEIAASVPLMASLAEDLSSRGSMRVTVLVSRPSMALSEADRLHEESNPNLEIIRLWNPFARKAGVLNKLLECLCFLSGAVLRTLAFSRVDVIFISSSPPLAGLPGALLGKLKRCPVIYNLQDLFPESAVASGMMRRNGLVFSLFSWVEQWTYRLTTRIIAIDDAFALHVKRLHPVCLMDVIPNWVNLDQMAYVPPERNAFLPLLGASRPFKVLYAGNLGCLQNLDLLLDAAKQLMDQQDIAFILVGEGNQKTALQKRVANEGLDNCIFIGFQPFERLADVYSACDLGVVPMRPGAGSSSIPSKTWNYFACSKPVIACVEQNSPFARLIDPLEAGWVVSPSDPHELSRAILAAFRDPDTCHKRGQAGRCFVESHLSQKMAIDHYYHVIRDTIRQQDDASRF